MGNKTLARKLRTKKEIKDKTPIFQTEAWEKRKDAIQKKHNNKQKIAKEKADKRKKKRKKEIIK